MERLGEAVRTELTTLEEVFTQRTELVAATRGARRQAEAVAQQLQGLAFWQGVPLSPLQVAEDVSFVEEYRWVTTLPTLLWQRFLNLGYCAPGASNNVWKHDWLSQLGEEVLLASGGWRTGMRLNTLQCTGRSPPARRICPMCQWDKVEKP